MKNILFIKTYVDLTEYEFNKKSKNELYDAVRGIWKVSKENIKNVQYVFLIHHNTIKSVYKVNQWHRGNTTHYKTRVFDKNDPNINKRFEFTGDFSTKMQHFIGMDVSRYYKRGEANPIKYMDLKLLNNNLFTNIIYPDDVDINNNIYSEGLKKQVIVNGYERNSEARKACLNRHGYTCFVCKFNFKNIYGELGENFIHVHHLKPLSEIKEEYKIDPINDLCPVCPNCHAMLHKRNPPYSIGELKNIIANNRNT